MWVWIIITLVASVILAIRIFYRQRSGVCRSKRRLEGKTVIVTGSSAGIGKETARDLAHRGARVILACRNLQKAQRALDDIISTTNNQQVLLRQLDTSDLASVRKFAKEIIDTEPALHVLVNNAGILGPSAKKVTSDGLELTLATNHFGHFLLTNMLLDLLKSSSPSRVVNVSSEAHRFCSDFDPEDLNYYRKPYPGSNTTYWRSKLCNILFTQQLAEKLHGTGVTANCLHPGVIYSEFFAKEGNKIFNYVANILVSLMGKDVKLGSQTTNYLAVSEEVENVSGEYFNECAIESTSLIAKDRGMAKQLWEASEYLVKLTPDDTSYKKKTN